MAGTQYGVLGIYGRSFADRDHHECSILGNEEIKNRLFSLDHISLSKENNLFLYIFTKLIY